VVAQVWNLLYRRIGFGMAVEFTPRARPFAGLAECNSAIRQSTKLRYEVRPASVMVGQIRYAPPAPLPPEIFPACQAVVSC
jgi:hypothetical protein